MADRERGDARLLRDLAAFERLTSGEEGEARRRLEAELGAEQAQILVQALSSTAEPESDDVRPAASA